MPVDTLALIFTMVSTIGGSMLFVQKQLAILTTKLDFILKEQQTYNVQIRAIIDDVHSHFQDPTIHHTKLGQLEQQLVSLERRVTVIEDK